MQEADQEWPCHFTSPHVWEDGFPKPPAAGTQEAFHLSRLSHGLLARQLGLRVYSSRVQDVSAVLLTVGCPTLLVPKGRTAPSVLACWALSGTWWSWLFQFLPVSVEVYKFHPSFQRTKVFLDFLNCSFPFLCFGFVLHSFVKFSRWELGLLVRHSVRPLQGGSAVLFLAPCLALSAGPLDTSVLCKGCFVSSVTWLLSCCQ